MQDNGWRDLGYNFLVDKCGTIFEGRKGGVDQPVLGAHTYGWNASPRASPSSVTTRRGRPAAALLTAIARLAA